MNLLYLLNGRWHAPALMLFFTPILFHMSEHFVQIVQLYVLQLDRSAAQGIVGIWFPAAVQSEVLHFGFAVFTLTGLVLLRPAFDERARFWWSVALAIEFWHQFEHVTLLFQRVTGAFFFGEAVPTSIVQVLVPRAELHLTYNSLVFVPMVIAVFAHLYPGASAQITSICGCCRRGGRPVSVSALSA
jgi:hypothetical protein